MTGANNPNRIEKKILYSILQKQPKRADVYWFLHVDVDDDPYSLEYRVQPLVPGKIIRVDFKLGFRIEPRINLLFRTVVEEMGKQNEVDIVSRYASLREAGVPGDFRFVVLKRHLSSENDLPAIEQIVMNGYTLLKKISLSEEQSFGLDTSSVTVEDVPLLIRPARRFEMTRAAT
jgi:KUP system potassium uptake protein